LASGDGRYKRVIVRINARQVFIAKDVVGVFPRIHLQDSWCRYVNSINDEIPHIFASCGSPKLQPGPKTWRFLVEQV
jgi:hypothetical protein